MAKKSRGRGPLKVLFVGNSFTSRNDLPGLISRLDTSVAGLFLGRFAHDPQALRTILDETAARLGLLLTAGGRP